MKLALVAGLRSANLVLVIDAVARHRAGHPESRSTQESSSDTESEHFLRNTLLLWLPLANTPGKVGAPARPVARGLITIRLFAAPKQIASKAFLWFGE